MRVLVREQLARRKRQSVWQLRVAGIGCGTSPALRRDIGAIRRFGLPGGRTSTGPQPLLGSFGGVDYPSLDDVLGTGCRRDRQPHLPRGPRRCTAALEAGKARAQESRSHPTLERPSLVDLAATRPTCGSRARDQFIGKAQETCGSPRESERSARCASRPRRSTGAASRAAPHPSPLPHGPFADVVVYPLTILTRVRPGTPVTPRTVGTPISRRRREPFSPFAPDFASP